MGWKRLNALVQISVHGIQSASSAGMKNVKCTLINLSASLVNVDGATLTGFVTRTLYHAMFELRKKLVWMLMHQTAHGILLMDCVSRQLTCVARILMHHLV